MELMVRRRPTTDGRAMTLQTSVPCASFIAIIVPMLLTCVGYAVIAVWYNITDRTEFADAFWRRDCTSQACNAGTVACMAGDSVQRASQAMVILWATNLAWHVICVGLLIFSLFRLHWRYFIAAQVVALVITAIGIVTAVLVLVQVECSGSDGSAASLRDLDFRLAHAFKILCVDLVVIFILTAGAVIGEYTVQKRLQHDVAGEPPADELAQMPPDSEPDLHSVMRLPYATGDDNDEGESVDDSETPRNRNANATSRVVVVT
jgi:hypothetical protein